MHAVKSASSKRRGGVRLANTQFWTTTFNNKKVQKTTKNASIITLLEHTTLLAPYIPLALEIPIVSGSKLNLKPPSRFEPTAVTTTGEEHMERQRRHPREVGVGVREVGRGPRYSGEALKDL